MQNFNDWTKSSLQKELNGSYLNSIKSPYKEMINNTVWSLGGLSSSSDENYFGTAISSTWYFYERGTIVYTNQPTEWTGKIGLMYPSEVGAPICSPLLQL